MGLPQRKKSQKNQLSDTVMGGVCLFDCGRKTGHPRKMHTDPRRTCKSQPKEGQTKYHVFTQVPQKNPTTFYEPFKKNKVSTPARPTKQKLVKIDC